MRVSLGDFCPINRWIPRGSDLIDGTTGRAYWNESRKLVWFKCLLLTIGTVPVHVFAALKTDAQTFGRIWNQKYQQPVPDPDFWTRVKIRLGLVKKTEQKVSWKWKAKQSVKDLGFIALSPVTIAALELSALYGLVFPWSGRKLYASFERLQYGDAVLAPCFQPDPVFHLLNIKINGVTF